MGQFDSGQRRAAELEAYQALWNLWHTSRRAAVNISNWESAREMLQTYYTVAHARQDSEVCAMRVRYLQISEPLPRLVDFVHAPLYRVPDAPRQLAQASYEFRLARQRHPERERQRLKELETTKVLYQAVKSAEARAEIAQRRERQQSRWPKGVVLESDIYNLDSIEAQVERQNARIEAQQKARGLSHGRPGRDHGPRRIGADRNAVAALHHYEGQGAVFTGCTPIAGRV